MSGGDLDDVNFAITEGGCSGRVEEKGRDVLDGLAVARALIAQGSEPGFFGLDADGDDLEG